MSKKLDEIRRWEAALAGRTKPSDGEWDRILQEADPEQWERCGCWEDSVANTFEHLFGDYFVGNVSKEYPRSTHGDGCRTNVFLLPGGTSVMIRFATWEMDGPDITIYHGQDCSKLVSLAWNLIDDGSDFGEICDDDNGGEFSEDTEIVVGGAKALAKKWKAAMSKRQ